jgi:hypothetical protein
MIAIRADLIGSTQASAAGIVVTGHGPVFRLCRALVRAGHDPETPLEAYRGATLCLRVRSIGEAAQLAVKDDKNGRPRFVRYVEERGAAAPPVRENELEATAP